MTALYIVNKFIKFIVDASLQIFMLSNSSKLLNVSKMWYSSIISHTVITKNSKYRKTTFRCRYNLLLIPECSSYHFSILKTIFEILKILLWKLCYFLLVNNDICVQKHLHFIYISGVLCGDLTECFCFIV